MFLVPKSPIVIPITEIPPENVLDGTLGIYAKDDGLHVVDKNNNDKTLITEPIFNNATKEKDTALAVGGYSKIAIDVSHYAGGWETDGIYIAVSPENLETFQHAEYIWVTYQGEMLKLRRSNFLEEMTIEQMWGGRLDSEPLIPIMDYQVFSYNNHDFDFTEGGLIRENLEPICVHDNVFEVKNNGEVKSPTIDGLYRRIDAGLIVCSAEGEAFSVHDSAELPMKKLSVLGKTKQLKTTGKNMIPFPYYDGMRKEINGITFVVNDDGSITANGKATGKASYTLFMPDLTDESKIKFLSPGEYVISANSGWEAVKCRIMSKIVGLHSTTAYANLNESSAGGSSGAVGAGVTDAYISYIEIAIYTGFVANNITFFPILEKGTTPTGYEPYTGGKPSPSPEYPQAIVDYSHNGGVSITLLGQVGQDIERKSVELPLIEGLARIDNAADEIDLVTGIKTTRLKRVVIEELSYAGVVDIANDGRDLYCGSIFFEGIVGNSGMCTIASCSNNAYDDGVQGIPSFSVFDGEVQFYIAADSEEDFRRKVIGCELLLQSSSVEQILDEGIDTEKFKNLKLFKPWTEFIPTGAVIDLGYESEPTLSMEYIADTKTYIDNKFAELQTAIISTGGNV